MEEEVEAVEAFAVRALIGLGGDAGVGGGFARGGPRLWWGGLAGGFHDPPVMVGHGQRTRATGSQVGVASDGEVVFVMGPVMAPAAIFSRRFSATKVVPQT